MVALPLIPAFDVHLAVAACGINDVDLFDGTTAAARMALDMFNNSFHSCMDKTFDEVDQDFKSYSSLTIASARYNCHQVFERESKRSFNGRLMNYVLGVTTLLMFLSLLR
eukprot:scaffold267772_cov29-Attheya_sp.AAC.1